MAKSKIKEKTLVIVKPDAFQRGLLGEIVDRFEQKGLKLVGLKMAQLTDGTLGEHYAEHRGKHFYQKLKEFMKKMPVVLIVWEGLEAVSVVRTLCGDQLMARKLYQEL